VVLTLTLGIGLTTLTYSVADALFFRPLAVQTPSNVVVFGEGDTRGTRVSNIPPSGPWSLFTSDLFVDLRQRLQSLDGIAAFAASDDAVSLSAASGTEAASDARAQLVSGTFFAVLRPRMVSGRPLRPDDDLPGAERVVVVGERLWRRRLAQTSAPDLKINGAHFAIVGVVAEDFSGVRLESTSQIWVPMLWQPDIQRSESVSQRHDYYWLRIVGRLKPTIDVQQAQTEATTTLRTLLAQQGSAAASVAKTTIVVVPSSRGISSLRDAALPPLSILSIGALAVLCLSILSVASVLTWRARERIWEIAVRRQLGARPRHVAAELLADAFVLAAFGGLLGLSAAVLTAPALLSVVVTGPVDVHINSRVFTAALGITILVALVIGAAPLIVGLRDNRLAGARRHIGAFRASRGLGHLFLALQLFLSLSLTLAAVLFIRSLTTLQAESFGFSRDKIVLVRLAVKPTEYSLADARLLYSDLRIRLSHLDGVTHVSYGRYSPFSQYRSTFLLQLVGSSPPPDQAARVEAVEVGPGYLETLGIPLADGRPITADDDWGAQRVAVVNRAFVNKFMLHGSPLGRTFRLNDSFIVVGIADDVRFHSAREVTAPMVYTSIMQESSARALDCQFAIRLGNSTSDIDVAVRRLVSELDPRIRISSITTLRDQVNFSFRQERLAAIIVTLFATASLIVAAVALYGSLSSMITHRRHELAMRVALGAGPGPIAWTVTRSVIVTLVLAAAMTFVAAALASSRVSPQLYGLEATDLPSLLAAILAVSATVFLALLSPIRRAVRTSPIEIIRSH
jgi:predicted permease